MEPGVYSIWISEQLEQLGHEVIGANVREMRAVFAATVRATTCMPRNWRGTLGSIPEILRPISDRTVGQQQILPLIRTRELLVRLRTASIYAVRGLTKACGYRMPASSTRYFAQLGRTAAPPGLKLALDPILTRVAEMTLKIEQYDREIQRLTQTEYVETQAMMTTHAAGHITLTLY